MAKKPGFEVVNRESTAAVIARQLREAIMYGKLPPNAQLSEVELSAQFGVSRGPLREAMQRLVQEGILRSEPNRGLFVRHLDYDDIRDVYTARTAIESAAALIVQRERGATSINKLRQACAAIERAAHQKDPSKLSDADLAFHKVLVAESASPRLMRMHDTLIVETRMCLTALENTMPGAKAVVDEHNLVIDAIENGDRSAVLQRIESHMQDALQRLVPGGAAMPPLFGFE